MSSELAISISGLSKCYQMYDKPRDRLLQMFSRGRRQYYQELWALREVSFNLQRGETLGVVGRNGAGKSTLLQLICGTLNPTAGEIKVNGRIAALLELGAGFNPEFTGKENVYLNAAVLGLTRDEINARYDDIVSFSGIGAFIDQPVKTYSSGMYVRLAFAVATSVDPSILVVDEALSVGDGEFARKSFDRIMELKKGGTTILFCSHAMYHIEAFCDRAIWLEQGQIRMLDSAQKVAAAYQAKLDVTASSAAFDGTFVLSQKDAKILKVYATADGNVGTSLRLASLKSRLEVTVEFAVDPSLPAPSVVLGVANSAGITVSSVSSADDGVKLRIDAQGKGQATIVFPNIPLLKGEYYITSIVACENAIHVYDLVERSIILQITQEGPAQGLVALPHEWKVRMV